MSLVEVSVISIAPFPLPTQRGFSRPTIPPRPGLLPAHSAALPHEGKASLLRLTSAGNLRDKHANPHPSAAAGCAGSDRHSGVAALAKSVHSTACLSPASKHLLRSSVLAPALAPPPVLPPPPHHYPTSMPASLPAGSPISIFAPHGVKLCHLHSPSPRSNSLSSF